MSRTTLETNGKITWLTCDELQSVWTFTDDWLAVQAQFALLKVFDWYENHGGDEVIDRAAFEQMAKFVARSYEQPLTAELFRALQEGTEVEGRRPLFQTEELPRWAPELIQGGKS